MMIRIYNLTTLYLLFLFLFFMMVFPSTFQGIKYPILFILLSISIFHFFNKKIYNLNIIKGVFFWLCYFLFTLLIGVFNGYKVDFELLNIYFFTPIVAYFLSNLIDNEYKFNFINKSLIFIALSICILDTLYLMSKFSIIHINLDFFDKIFGSAKIDNSIVEFRITNQVSLMFLMPYLFSLKIKNIKKIYINIILNITILLGLIITLFSGRRALQLVVILSYFYILYLNRKKFNIKKVLKFVFGIILVLTFLYYILNEYIELNSFYDSLSETFFSAFDSNTNSGEIRIKQSSALLNGFLESPIFGNGLNSYPSEIVRSNENPWSYEMVYYALLYQTGSIGFIIFFGFVYMLFVKNYKSYKLTNNIFFFSIAFGFVFIVFAGSSNPLIYYVWVWFLVFCAYNFTFESQSTFSNNDL